MTPTNVDNDAKLCALLEAKQLVEEQGVSIRQACRNRPISATSLARFLKDSSRNLRIGGPTYLSDADEHQLALLIVSLADAETSLLRDRIQSMVRDYLVARSRLDNGSQVGRHWWRLFKKRRGIRSLRQAKRDCKFMTTTVIDDDDDNQAAADPTTVDDASGSDGDDSDGETQTRKTQAPNSSKQAALEHARQLVAEGQSMRSACRDLPISATSLARFMKNEKRNLRIGGPTLLTDEEESHLCALAIRMAISGMPLLKRKVMQIVTNYVQANCPEKQLANSGVSRHWWRNFQARHCQLPTSDDQHSALSFWLKWSPDACPVAAPMANSPTPDSSEAPVTRRDTDCIRRIEEPASKRRKLSKAGRTSPVGDSARVAGDAAPWRDSGIVAAGVDELYRSAAESLADAGLGWEFAQDELSHDIVITTTRSGSAQPSADEEV